MMTSRLPLLTGTISTPGGSSPSVAMKLSGALRSASVDSGLMPSFCGNGVPE